MSNFLETIENEYSRLRGLPSRLSPLDWNLAQDWEDSGLPLHIVLRAMGEVAENFHAQKRTDKINGLRYFKQAVEKQFDEWKSSQVGKSIVSTEIIEENTRQNQTVAEMLCKSDDNVEVLESFVENFSTKTDLPEPLKSAVAQTRQNLLLVIEQTKANQLNSDEIEASLNVLSDQLNLSLVLSISDAERAQMIAKIKSDYGKFSITDDVRAKVLNRELRERFGLPELSLYAL